MAHRRDGYGPDGGGRHRWVSEPATGPIVIPPPPRAVIDWLTNHRITDLEVRMSATSDAYAELDAQLNALEAYVTNDDTTDAAEVTARADRIRALLAAVNPSDPAPAPGEDGAVEPDPTAPIVVDETPDAPADPDGQA